MDTNSNSSQEPKKRRRGKWPFIILGSLVVVIVIGWSVIWFFLANQAEKIINSTLAEYSEQGLNLNCENIAIGGYPFRLRASCKSFTVGIENEIILMAEELRGVALVYNPRHLIFEVESPVSIFGGPIFIKADWDLIQASVNFANLGFSVVLDSANFTTNNEEELFNISSFEIHGRFEDEGELTGFDFNLKVRELIQKINLNDFEIPSEIDLDIHIPVDEFFFQGFGQNLFVKFIEQGGEVQLNQARIKLRETELNLSGVVNFDQAGDLSGKLNLMVVGIESLLELINRQNNRQLALLSSVIEGLSSKDENGVSTALIPIKIDDGFISQIGIVPLPRIFRIPPLPRHLTQNRDNGLN